MKHCVGIVVFCSFNHTIFQYLFLMLPFFDRSFENPVPPTLFCATLNHQSTV